MNPSERVMVFPHEIKCEICGTKMGITTFNRNGNGVFGKVCDDCEKLVSHSIASLLEEGDHARKA